MMRKLLLLALVAVGCRYSPEVPSGVQSCGDRNVCPPGLACSATGRCCTPGDESARCKGTNPGKPDAGTGKVEPPSPVNFDASIVPEVAPVDAVAALDAGDATVDSLPPSRGFRVKRLTTARDDLITYWLDCTVAPASKLGRWCTFARQDELWVINLTRAASGTVTCDGTDASCLRLTTKLFREVEDFTSFANPTFWGDLLIFHAEAKTEVSRDYRGGIFAWMPGWPAAKKLTSSDGLKCQAASENDTTWTPAVYCVDKATPTGEVELLATPDVTTTPLALIARLPPERPGMLAPLAGTAALSVDGNFIVYRSGGPGQRSLLRASTRPAPADKPTLIAEDVQDWRLATDGKDVYFLHPNGRLSWANVQDPNVKGDIALQVGAFEVQFSYDNRDNGVAALTNLATRGGQLKVFLNRTSTEGIDVGKSYEAGFDLASDRRYTIFQPSWNVLGLGSVSLMDNTTREVCTLQPKVRAWTFNTGSFSSDSTWVVWSEVQGDSDKPDLWLARSKGCSEPRMVATDEMQQTFVDDRGLLVLHGWTEAKGGTLQYFAWGPNQTYPEAGPTTVFTGVDSFEHPRLGETLIPFTSVEPGKEGLYVMEIPR